jgi:hypothetical protein
MGAEVAMNATTDTPVPQDVDAETAVLSCCLLDGMDKGSIRSIDHCREVRLLPAAFAHTPNRVIYERINAMEDAGLPIALDTLAEELKAKGQLETVGGQRYLSTVAGWRATTAEIRYLVERVQVLYKQRRLTELSRMVVLRSAEGTLPATAHGLASLAQTMADEVLESASDFGWPKPVSAAALQANPPPTTDELIQGVLYRGGTMMLCGPSKAHKTYTLLEMALAVACGTNWLGFKTCVAPVLYVNLELQGHAVAKRLTQICSAKGIEAPHSLHFQNLRGKWVTADDLCRRLPKLIKDLGVGLVVVDPHYKVSSTSGAEENSNDQQGQLLAVLEGVCNQHGAALALAHHFAKGDSSSKNAIDRASGAGVMARWGDVMMTMTPHEEEDAMVMEMSLRNFAPVRAFVVRWEQPRWVRDDELNPALLRRAGRHEMYPADDALKKLGEGGLTYGEWWKATGMTESTFRRKLKELTTAGRLRQNGPLYYPKAA